MGEREIAIAIWLKLRDILETVGKGISLSTVRNAQQYQDRIGGCDVAAEVSRTGDIDPKGH